MTELRTIAALYVDPRGPYPSMPGVDCWDETRDAKLYNGPHPVVAHPPCGPWGRLRFFCTKQDASCGPRAVEQVRAFGGVLEHPEFSRLWRECGMPFSGEWPDKWGGRTVSLDQVQWGHRCRKRTWVYFVGLSLADVWQSIVSTADLSAVATHGVNGGRKERLPGASHEVRRLTPPPFAEWLVSVARSANLRKDPS